MKTTQKPDKRIHIRKKVAGGTTGAVLGAVVGGPVGALVGGVIGTVVGGAAESGRLQKLASTANAMRGNRIAKAKPALKRAAAKGKRSGQKARGARAKGKSKRASK
jgi:uncharacterized membrane protein